MFYDGQDDHVTLYSTHETLLKRFYNKNIQNFSCFLFDSMCEFLKEFY